MTVVLGFVAALLLVMGAFMLTMLLDSMVAEILGKTAFRPKLWVVVAAVSFVSIAMLVTLTQPETRGNAGVMFGLFAGLLVIVFMPAKLRRKCKMTAE